MNQIEEIKFLEYYLENVIEDLQTSINLIKEKYYCEIEYNPTELNRDLYKLLVNEEVEKLINKQEFKIYLSIIKKYYSYSIDYDYKDSFYYLIDNALKGDIYELLEDGFLTQCIINEIKEEINLNIK